ncbi:MAG: hypothetical protein OJF49_001951 [Ktedonobacterales bacterium]|nr:MAG: hypothetical protein OJF49_001951 [Ktedonobacterales bacterium]
MSVSALPPISSSPMPVPPKRSAGTTAGTMAPPPHAVIVERRAYGVTRRNDAPRSSHALWTPSPDRPDPISLLEASNRSRIHDLTPIRYGRMLASPFAFLRGSAIIMASDLSTTPNSGIHVQLTGDAHICNYGVFATPERKVVFGINDFDETLPGPWEWDLKRLAASIIVAGRENGFSNATCREAAELAVRTYRERMHEFSTMSHMEVWCFEIDVRQLFSSLMDEADMQRGKRAIKKTDQRTVRQAERRTADRDLGKLAEVVNGQLRLKNNPPLLVRVEDPKMLERLRGLTERYRATLEDNRDVLLNRYHLVDVARKVVGVGSVGTYCGIALMLGNDGEDPLFLQLKEAQPSVMEAYVGRSRFSNSGQRVVYGQRLIQAASDIFLGWTRSGNIDFYVRQLHDMKYSPEIDELDKVNFTVYVMACAYALARAHARSGDAAQISGYIGGSDKFDRAITTFAEVYADQNERDYTELVAATRSGRVPAEMGV